MSKPADGRVNPVFRAMKRPLTVLGAERRLFFVALISGGSIFSLLHSHFGGIALFFIGVLIARRPTKHDVEILKVLFNSGKFRRRYDPMKPLHETNALTCMHWPSRWSGAPINDDPVRIARRDAQG